MRADFNIRARTVMGIAVGGFISVSASAATAQSIQGTATYRERIALQPAAVFEAVLEDVTRVDAPAETIARTRMASPGSPPIAFTIACDPSKIAPNHRYVVLARILVDDKPMFATQDPKRDAHLQFQGGRVSGSDGCNRLTGTYQLSGDRVAFGQMAGTQMACVNPSGTGGPFRDALKSATRLTVAGDRLELFDASGTGLAVFAAGNQASRPSPPPTLSGTSWQLVKFQGSDDTTRAPDDRSKYTIEFGAGGRLTARVDCNRGGGTWKSSGPSQLEFGPLALTRAQCPAGSLHDQIVKQWRNVRSYVVKDGHLFLSLMADGGIYEFEPIAGNTPK